MAGMSLKHRIPKLLIAACFIALLGCEKDEPEIPNQTYVDPSTANGPIESIEQNFNWGGRNLTEFTYFAGDLHHIMHSSLDHVSIDTLHMSEFTLNWSTDHQSLFLENKVHIGNYHGDSVFYEFENKKVKAYKNWSLTLDQFRGRKYSYNNYGVLSGFTEEFEVDTPSIVHQVYMSGGNVDSVVIVDPGYRFTVVYTYDNKINPFRRIVPLEFFREINYCYEADYLTGFNKNNLISKDAYMNGIKVGMHSNAYSYIYNKADLPVIIEDSFGNQTFIRYRDESNT